MKNLIVELKFIVESLNTLSQSVEAITNRLEKGSPGDKPESKPKRTVATKPKVKAVPKNKIKPTLKVTAADTAKEVKNKSRKDVNRNTLKIKDINSFWQ